MRTRDLDDTLPADAFEMVAIDLDGTLLRSDGTIGTLTRQAIAAAIERGVKVVLASARPPRGTRPYYQKLGLDTLMVNHNGALIFDAPRNRPLYHGTLDGKLARDAVLLALRRDPRITVGIELMDQIVGFKGKGRPIRSAKDIPEDAQRMLSRDVTKVMLIGESAGLSDIQGELHRTMEDRIGFAFSNMTLLQIVRGGIDKGKSVAAVAAYYKIPRQRVLAIGDAPNDLGMLTWAGLGVAMGNAWDPVRRAAKMVTASNDEDGVGQAIQQYVLI